MGTTNPVRRGSIPPLRASAAPTVPAQHAKPATAAAQPVRAREPQVAKPAQADIA